MRLRPLVAEAQLRYYEPVIDDLPGVQCQVDGGELRDVVIAGKATTVYFLVFVLSFSRLMHVSLSTRPIDTNICIQMHDAAFRYFGGLPEECVYDQAKLVVISEEFRELTLNERFRQYANRVGLSVHACEGYDPESKGKVEAGVKYVKGDCLYGDDYQSLEALQGHLQGWLDEVANQRVHATTGQIPAVLYDAKEKAAMKPYVAAQAVAAVDLRKADKTGLISYRANKYSVPMAYQRCTVGVDVIEDRLIITDVLQSTRIASHTLVMGNGHVIKNTDHYRDPSVRIADYESRLQALLGEDAGKQLCDLLRLTSPKIYRDQLGGALRILGQLDVVDERLIARFLAQPRLTATGLRAYVEAFQRKPDGLSRDEPHQPAQAALLAQYAGVSCTAREVSS